VPTWRRPVGVGSDNIEPAAMAWTDVEAETVAETGWDRGTKAATVARTAITTRTTLRIARSHR
jgi:hypothetical protein